MSETYFITFGPDGNATGTGFTPDGTVPENALPCTVEQRDSWQGSTREDDEIIPPSEEYLSVILADAAIVKRDALLSASDKYDLRSTPEDIYQAWKPYRQALRDLTDQASFPEGIDWPVAPTI